jgi:HAD superfamily hydrolase (TIGR01509 family)
MTDLKNLVNQYPTILFDMDGTLVNTEPLHAEAAMMVLNELGIKIDLMACLKDFYGMTDTIVIKTMCPQMSEKEINFAIERKNQFLIGLFKALPQNQKEKYINHGLFDFLNYLNQLNKKMAVVSASEDIIVKETLNCFNISPLIRLQMGRGQTINTKPHPEPYLEAMKRLNAVPSETLIFEDSPTGLRSAKDSLAKVIRITGFTHDDSQSEFFEIKNFLF